MPATATLPTQAAVIQPVWIPMPRQGKSGERSPRCQHSGLTRAMLYMLSVPCKGNKWNAPVKSKCIKRNGSKRGVRLVHYASLMAHIESL